MKKLMILAAVAVAALLLAAACGPKPNFTIVGRPLAGSRAEGAHLLEYATDTLIRAKCIAKDGVFNIKGHIDEPRFARVVQDDLFNEWYVILEPGIIYLNLADKAATGTPLNDALSEYFEAASDLYYNRDSEEEPEARNRELVLDFVARHNNDIAGAYVLASTYPVLSLDDMKGMLKQAGPVFLNSEFVTFLKGKIRALNED